MKFHVVKPGPLRLTQYGTESALQLLLEEAEFDSPKGRVADYIPELSRANPDERGISICYLDGIKLSAGVCKKRFTIQSISKPLALLHVLESIGPKQVFSRVGKEPTGEPFNSGLRFQVASKRPLNPMINAGAIVVSSMFPGNNPDDQFEGFLNFARKVCGNPNLEVDEGVYRSEKMTGHNNRSLAWIMNDRRVFWYKDNFSAVEFIEGVLDVYFRQCSIGATTADLAHFGGLLANHGVDPTTGERHASDEHVGMVIALMASCGLYDGSGTFASKIGIPSKSGVGGAIVAVAPGKIGIATYGPALDSAGNSCFGLYALERISRDEELGIFSCPRLPFSLKTYSPTFLISTSDPSSADLPMMNGRNLSALQPRVNDSLVIFPLKRASGPWGIQAPLPKSDKRKHLSRALVRKHWTLSRTPSQSVNPRQYLGPYLLADRDFRHLKRHHPAMADHFRSDLDQFAQ